MIVNNYNNNQVFAYDYFIKDHLGNTRTVLTDELEQDIYPAATLENGAYPVESNYYQINQADIVPNPPSLPATYENNNDGIPNPDPGININATSAQMYRLNGETGDKTGLGITLKVMAGDNVTIFGTSFWQNTGGPIDNTDYNVAISSLLTKKGDRYDPNTNSIYWNPNEGIVTKNGSKLSQATSLNHEADHANDIIKDPVGHIARANTPDANHDNAEEARVIKGSEQTTALGMGEIKEGGVTRTDHSLLATIQTKDPLSTVGKVIPVPGTLNPVIITAKHHKK